MTRRLHPITGEPVQIPKEYQIAVDGKWIGRYTGEGFRRAYIVKVWKSKKRAMKAFEKVAREHPSSTIELIKGGTFPEDRILVKRIGKKWRR